MNPNPGTNGYPTASYYNPSPLQYYQRQRNSTHPQNVSSNPILSRPPIQNQPTHYFPNQYSMPHQNQRPVASHQFNGQQQQQFQHYPQQPYPNPVHHQNQYSQPNVQQYQSMQSLSSSQQMNVPSNPHHAMNSYHHQQKPVHYQSQPHSMNTNASMNKQSICYSGWSPQGLSNPLIQYNSNNQSSGSVSIPNKSKSSTPGSRSRSRSRERNQRIGTMNHLNHLNQNNNNNKTHCISTPTSNHPQDTVLDDLHSMHFQSQSHEEFIAFYANSRIEHEQKLDEEEELNAMDDDTNLNWMRFNHLLLPILYQFGHRRGNRIGIKDYGANRRMMNGALQSEILFSDRDRRRYDKTYGVDFPIPEKKKKVKKPKNALSILSELMQLENLKANAMYEINEYEGGNLKECSFRFEGKWLAHGTGSTKVEAKRECALNAVSKLRTDPMLKPRFGIMILTKELGLTVSKQKGKKKKKKMNQNGKNRHSKKTYSSVPVALGGKITHNAAFGGAECRYRYVNHPQGHLQRDYNNNNHNKNDNKYNGNHDEVQPEYAVDELYLERWDEFDGRGHEIPTHRHALLDDKGRRLQEVEVMTEVAVDTKKVKTEIDYNINDLKEEILEVKTAVKVEEEPMIICMPPPHAVRQKMSVDC